MPRTPAGVDAEAPWSSALWYAGAALVFWSFGYTQVPASDLWWHLAGGRWIVEHHAIPVVDPWSYTARGAPWLNDAWLSGLIYYAWATWLGVEALVWWRWLLVVATFLTLLWTLRRLTNDALASFVAAVAGIAVAAPFLDTRPHLYSLLGYVLLLASGLVLDRRWWRLLPALFLVWANLHAMFLFGLIALAVLLAPALVDPTTRRRAALVGIGCLLACLVNPHGLAVISRPLRYAFDPTSPFRAITEWASPLVDKPGGITSPLYPWAIGIGAVASAYVLSAALRGRRGSTPWVSLALAMLTLAMSIRSRRFVPLFAVSLGLVLAPTLAALLPQPGRWRQRVEPVLAGLLGIFWLAPLPRSSEAFLHLGKIEAFPVDTMNFIEANRIDGKVFAFYNWGGYVDYRTQGALQVFIDGRADMVFSDDTYRQYARALGLQRDWRSVIESSDSDYVLWPDYRRDQIDGLLESGRWEVLYTDHVSWLLVRSGRRPPGELRSTPPSPWRDLAMGERAIREDRLDDAERHLQAALDARPGLVETCMRLVAVRLARDAGAAARATWQQCRRFAPGTAPPAALAASTAS
jgi:hypothetical protein